MMHASILYILVILRNLILQSWVHLSGYSFKMYEYTAWFIVTAKTNGKLFHGLYTYISA